MTFFEESGLQPRHTLSTAQVAHYRDVLVNHANDPANRKCRICHQTGCADWRSAYDRLAIAGELMADPKQGRVDHSGLRP